MARDDNVLLDAFLQNRTMLIEIARPILGCRYKAEDVVQDAYIRLLDSGRRAAVRQPAAYLYRTVRNLAVDRARRLALEARYGANEDVPLSASASEPSPEGTAVARNLLSTIERALGELPERTRMVFEMHRLGGYSQQEVADSLGISVSLVAMLVRDALTHCRDRLRAIDRE